MATVSAKRFAPNKVLHLPALREAPEMKLRERGQAPSIAFEAPAHVELSGVALEGPWNTARSLTFSPDGETLVTGTVDGTVCVWNAATRERLRALVKHPTSVCRVRFEPDGATLASASLDGTLLVWNTATWTVERTLDARSSADLRAVDWSERDASTDLARDRIAGDGWPIVSAALVSGRREAVVASNESVRLYDLDTHRLVAEVRCEHEHATHAVAVSPDGETLACGADNGPVRLWEMNAIRRDGTPSRHVSTVRSGAASPDGTLAITGGSDRTARLWNLSTGESLSHTFEDGCAVASVRFTRDGRLALAANDVGALAALDARSGELVRAARFANPRTYLPFFEMRELSDGRLLVGVGVGELALWSLDGRSDAPERFDGVADGIVGLDLDADEQVVVTVHRSENVASVAAWNLSDRSLRWRFTRVMNGHTSGVRVVGERVVVTTSAGALLVLRLHDGELLRALTVWERDPLTGVVVTGPEEVVVLSARPARVDLSRGVVIERVNAPPWCAYLALEGERRALRITRNSVAEIDLVAGTVTPDVTLDALSGVTPTGGSPFVAVAPKSRERSGTVVVLRRAGCDRYAVAAPKLELFNAPIESKTAEQKRLASARGADKREQIEKRAFEAERTKARRAKLKAAKKAATKKTAAKKRSS